MSLAIYTKPAPEDRISNTDDLYRNILSISLDGQIGGAIVNKLYIRNDNEDYYYSDISIVPVDTGTINHINTGKWSWKLREGDIAPQEGHWAAISSGNTISFADSIGTTRYGDLAVYLPFWLRVETPPNKLAQNIKTITIQISAIEHMVGY